MTEVPFLNIFDPDFHYEHPSITEAREQSWYAQTPLGPIVLRHEDVWALLRDRRLVPGGRRYMHKIGITEGPLYDWFVEMLASLAPDAHARVRGLVNKAFSPRMVEGLRPVVRSIAERLANEIADRGDECEFVEAFAEPLPALVMCEMLGVPAEDYDQFHRWANEIGLVFNTSADLARSEAAVVGLSEYVESLVARRREAPGPDLISSLIQTEEAGERLTTAELHNLLVLLVWAAQDTTARQLGRAVVAFSQYPEQWQLLYERPELLPQAVEEICRWSPQARLTFRAVNEDVIYRDLELPTDSMLLFSIFAANRDPRSYRDPDRLDIEAARESRQLVFGGGPYTCLGSGAARLELTEGLAALVRRFGPPSVEGQITWGPPTAMIHGPHELPLRLIPRSRGAAPESRLSFAT
jgi:cytochrome P450